MIGTTANQWRAAMSAAANKKLVQQVFADSANRSGTTFADNLAEDATLGRHRPIFLVA